MFRRRAPRLSGAVGRAEFTFHEFTTLSFMMAVLAVIAATFGLGVVNEAHRLACNVPGLVDVVRSWL